MPQQHSELYKFQPGDSVRDKQTGDKGTVKELRAVGYSTALIAVVVYFSARKISKIYNVTWGQMGDIIKTAISPINQATINSIDKLKKSIGVDEPYSTVRRPVSVQEAMVYKSTAENEIKAVDLTIHSDKIVQALEKNSFPESKIKLAKSFSLTSPVIKDISIESILNSNTIFSDLFRPNVITSMERSPMFIGPVLPHIKRIGISDSFRGVRPQNTSSMFRNSVSSFINPEQKSSELLSSLRDLGLLQENTDRLPSFEEVYGNLFVAAQKADQTKLDELLVAIKSNNLTRQEYMQNIASQREIKYGLYAQSQLAFLEKLGITIPQYNPNPLPEVLTAPIEQVLSKINTQGLEAYSKLGIIGMIPEEVETITGKYIDKKLIEPGLQQSQEAYKLLLGLQASLFQRDIKNNPDIPYEAVRQTILEYKKSLSLSSKLLSFEGSESTVRQMNDLVHNVDGDSSNEIIESATDALARQLGLSNNAGYSSRNITINSQVSLNDAFSSFFEDRKDKNIPIQDYHKELYENLPEYIKNNSYQDTTELQNAVQSIGLSDKEINSLTRIYHSYGTSTSIHNQITVQEHPLFDRLLGRQANFGERENTLYTTGYSPQLYDDIERDIHRNDLFRQNPDSYTNFIRSSPLSLLNTEKYNGKLPNTLDSINALMSNDSIIRTLSPKQLQILDNKKNSLLRSIEALSENPEYFDGNSVVSFQGKLRLLTSLPSSQGIRDNTSLEVRPINLPNGNIRFVTPLTMSRADMSERVIDSLSESTQQVSTLSSVTLPEIKGPLNITDIDRVSVPSSLPGKKDIFLRKTSSLSDLKQFLSEPIIPNQMIEDYPIVDLLSSVLDRADPDDIKASVLANYYQALNDLKFSTRTISLEETKRNLLTTSVWQTALDSGRQDVQGLLLRLGGIHSATDSQSLKDLRGSVKLLGEQSVKTIDESSVNSSMLSVSASEEKDSVNYISTLLEAQQVKNTHQDVRVISVTNQELTDTYKAVENVIDARSLGHAETLRKLRKIKNPELLSETAEEDLKAFNSAIETHVGKIIPKDTPDFIAERFTNQFRNLALTTKELSDIPAQIAAIKAKMIADIETGNRTVASHISLTAELKKLERRAKYLPELKEAQTMGLLYPQLERAGVDFYRGVDNLYTGKQVRDSVKQLLLKAPERVSSYNISEADTALHMLVKHVIEMSPEERLLSGYSHDRDTIVVPIQHFLPGNDKPLDLSLRIKSSGLDLNYNLTGPGGLSFRVNTFADDIAHPSVNEISSITSLRYSDFAYMAKPTRLLPVYTFIDPQTHTSRFGAILSSKPENIQDTLQAYKKAFLHKKDSSLKNPVRLAPHVAMFDIETMSSSFNHPEEKAKSVIGSFYFTTHNTRVQVSSKEYIDFLKGSQLLDNKANALKLQQQDINNIIYELRDKNDALSLSKLREYEHQKAYIDAEFTSLQEKSHILTEVDDLYDQLKPRDNLFHSSNAEIQAFRNEVINPIIQPIRDTLSDPALQRAIKAGHELESLQSLSGREYVEVLKPYFTPQESKELQEYESLVSQRFRGRLLEDSSQVVNTEELRNSLASTIKTIRGSQDTLLGNNIVEFDIPQMRTFLQEGTHPSAIEALDSFSVIDTSDLRPFLLTQEQELSETFIRTPKKGSASKPYQTFGMSQQQLGEAYWGEAYQELHIPSADTDDLLEILKNSHNIIHNTNLDKVYIPTATNNLYFDQKSGRTYKINSGGVLDKNSTEQLGLNLAQKDIHGILLQEIDYGTGIEAGFTFQTEAHFRGKGFIAEIINQSMNNESSYHKVRAEAKVRQLAVDKARKILGGYGQLQYPNTDHLTEEENNIYESFITDLNKQANRSQYIDKIVGHLAEDDESKRVASLIKTNKEAFLTSGSDWLSQYKQHRQIFNVLMESETEALTLGKSMKDILTVKANVLSETLNPESSYLGNYIQKYLLANNETYAGNRSIAQYQMLTPFFAKMDEAIPHIENILQNSEYSNPNHVALNYLDAVFQDSPTLSQGHFDLLNLHQPNNPVRDYTSTFEGVKDPQAFIQAQFEPSRESVEAARNGVYTINNSVTPLEGRINDVRFEKNEIEELLHLSPVQTGKEYSRFNRMRSLVENIEKLGSSTLGKALLTIGAIAVGGEVVSRAISSPIPQHDADSEKAGEVLDTPEKRINYTSQELIEKRKYYYQQSANRVTSTDVQNYKKNLQAQLQGIEVNSLQNDNRDKINKQKVDTSRQLRL